MGVMVPSVVVVACLLVVAVTVAGLTHEWNDAARVQVYDVFGVNEVAVQPAEAVAGAAGQPVSVPGDWLRTYAVGVKGDVQARPAEVAVTEAVERAGVANVPAWARPYGPVEVTVQ